MRETTATIIESYHYAWNRHDARAISALFAKGGVTPIP